MGSSAILVGVFPGVAQLVERLLWEQEAQGSRPCTWTRPEYVQYLGHLGFLFGGLIVRMTVCSLHKGGFKSPPWSTPPMQVSYNGQYISLPS